MAFQPPPLNRDGRRGGPCGTLLERAGALGVGEATGGGVSADQ